MKARSEELLYLMMWSADMLLRPSWRNLNGSFESWAAGQGLVRRLAALEREKLIELQSDQAGVARIVRLTEAGRLAALAGIDPEQAWNRAWDGRWRLVMFDVPELQNKSRVKLRRALRALRFGYLQNSVWLSPDPLESLKTQIATTTAAADALTLFEGRPAGGETDADLVAAAWNWERVKLAYERWSRVADSMPAPKTLNETAMKAVQSWSARERDAWREVVAHDPFLPSPLLPAAYPGRKSWERRVRLLHTAGKLVSASLSLS